MFCCLICSRQGDILLIGCFSVPPWWRIPSGLGFPTRPEGALTRAAAGGLDGRGFLRQAGPRDGFRLPGSGRASVDAARALSGVSIGGGSTSVNGFGAEDGHEAGNVLVLETPGKESLAVDVSAAVAQCDGVPLDEGVQSSVAVDTVEDVGSPGSSTGKSVGSTATGVKQVQWGSFSSSQGLLVVGGFGSYSNFFTKVPDVLTNQLVSGTETNDAVADFNTNFGSFENEYPIIPHAPFLWNN